MYVVCKDLNDFFLPHREFATKPRHTSWETVISARFCVKSHRKEIFWRKNALYPERIP